MQGHIACGCRRTQTLSSTQPMKILCVYRTFTLHIPA